MASFKKPHRVPFIDKMSKPAVGKASPTGHDVAQ